MSHQQHQQGDDFFYQSNQTFPNNYEQQQQQQPQQSQIQTSATTSTTQSSSSSSKIESTYQSLIQQYLSLLQYDNAIFIAERYVAFHSTSYSNYLLAMCYYQNHNVQYAKRILTSWSTTTGGTNNKKNNDNNSDMDEKIMYLLAKCNIDLHLFRDAEDILLKNARMQYIHYKKKCKDEWNKEKQKGKQQYHHSNNIHVASTLEDYLMDITSSLVHQNHNKKNKIDNDNPMSMMDQKEVAEEIDNESNKKDSKFNITYTISKDNDQHGGFSDRRALPIPNGAAGLHLLGYICQKTMRKDKASIYYQLALKLDPMMWTSYAALCEMGFVTSSNKELDPASIFGAIPSNLTKIPQSKGGYGIEKDVSFFDLHHQSSNNPKSVENKKFLSRIREMGGDAQSPFHIMNSSPIMTKTSETEGVEIPPGGHNSSAMAGYHNQSSSFVPQTPYVRNFTMQGASNDDHNDNSALCATSLFPQEGGGGNNTTNANLPSTTLFATPGLTPIPHDQPQHQYLTYSSGKKEEVFSRAKQIASRLYYDQSLEMTPPPPGDASSSDKTPTPPHSVSSATPSMKTVRRKQFKSRTDYLMSVDETKHDEYRNLDEDMDLTEDNKDADVKNSDMENPIKLQYDNHEYRVEAEDVGGHQGVQHILELFCTLGAAQRMLCSFHCKEAIQIYRSLPNNQYNTGFVQHQIGRAYFEMADYANAQRAFETMQRVESYRMKGLELLSTVYWHLQKDVELSSLAQRAVDFDKLAPESWCVVGNCFSLQKEHETALAFFRRSIQLDSHFTYSHTLSGHEYLSNEDFDQAIVCFRNAIRNDDRHYTAWYGLGSIYFQQQKYDLAEYHYKKALSINPQSSVLHCHLGKAQHENGKFQEALDTLTFAFKVDPRNPQARYQRAIIWMSIGKPEEALKELEKVRDAAPTEACIHFEMGKVLKQLERPQEAMKCFLTALDLDPKDNNSIKAAIDRLDEPEVLEEDNSAY